MSYGIQIKNNGGGILIDDVYPQLNFKLSGNAPSTPWWGIGAAYNRQVSSVTFSQTVNNPTLFFRTSLNNYVVIYAVTSTGFTYSASDTVNWKVYNADVLNYTPTGNGIFVKNSSNQFIFDSNNTPPSINQIISITNPTVTISTPIDSVISTQTITTSASDGGLPYINASATLPTASIQDNNLGTAYAFGVAAKFTSSTSLEIHHGATFAAYDIVLSSAAVVSPCGQNPRLFLLTP